MKKNFMTLTVAFFAALLLCLINPAIGEEQPSSETPEVKSELTQTVQKDVDNSAEEKISKQRKEILAEATAAITESRRALKSLDEENVNAALKSLELAIGKMELIIAREPELVLAPVDVSVKIFDLYAQVGAIEATVEQAEDYLEDGQVQKARHLIANLASEMVIESVNIPLATYPDAIKKIVPLIDKGKIEEAGRALQTALNTLIVVEEEVIPLPVVRAKVMLEGAEKLAKMSDRKEEDSEKLATLLDGAQSQLKLSEVLGYGDKKAFKPMYEQLDSIRKKTKDSKHGIGFFDKLKKQISQLVE